MAVAQVCPIAPIPSVTVAKPPADVCVPSSFTGLAIDYFDDYSWRTFISLVWPAVYGGRGLPDEERKVSGAGPRVFETFKPAWEIFHKDGTGPVSSDFQEYEAASRNACSARAGYGDMVLASFSGFHDFGQAGDTQVGEADLAGPLVTQNRRYVRYLTSYNEIAFHHIESNKWYLRSALPAGTVPRPAAPGSPFPVGSVVVQSAWMDVAGLTATQKARLHVRMAITRESSTAKCSLRPVGLIGIHIARKTTGRPQWIWSSFEQVDLAPPADPGAEVPYLLNDGTGTPMPEANPLSLIPLAKPPVTPFNVERLPKAPIHPQTKGTNAAYRKLLSGSVWQQYQLVVSQWPQAPGDQSLPVSATQTGEISLTFPGEGATSAYSNLAIETFRQARPAQGCMSCHNGTRLATDFIWSVQRHAYPEQIALPKPSPRKK